jgi:hypothetical protein
MRLSVRALNRGSIVVPTTSKRIEPERLKTRVTYRHLHPSNITLIATLGSEPQVVTAALDLLLRQGEKVRQVQVLHSVAPSGPIWELIHNGRFYILDRLLYGLPAQPPPSPMIDDSSLLAFFLHPGIDITKGKLEGIPVTE